MFPIRPKQENYLAGTMGELRSSHFHTGLDIKTSGITGLPVYAIADGYIQRVRVSLGGYGNALYMVHPETGMISVYGHLKSFDEDIAEYVREKQYAKESFATNLFPKRNKFFYKKGDVIALSGNSGSSSGPHLHFEIRDKNHRALDPLTFGFTEIIDTKPPILSKIAFVTMDVNARVNGMYGRFEFVLEHDESGYPILPEDLSLFGNIGVEVYAYDKFDGANNRNGIRFQTLSWDGQVMFDQRIDTLSFSKGREILVHTNYKRSVEGGSRFNKLYVDHGNELDFYSTSNHQSGLLAVFDPLVHRLGIKLEDGYGNIHQVEFLVNENGSSRSREFKNTYSLDRYKYDLMGNILEVESMDTNCKAKIFVNGSVVIKPHDYYTDVTANYLWDMRNGIPDSISLCGKSVLLNYSALIPAKRKYDWKSGNASVSFPSRALFDSMYLNFESFVDAESKEVFQFNNVSTAFRKNVTVRLKPAEVYDLQKSRVYARSSGGKLSFVGGSWKGEELEFKTRNLGTYTISTDSVPPTITRKKSKYGQLKFRIKDVMSGIQSIRAELNDEWLLMNFDPKSGNVWSDEKVKISGHFSFSVKDNSSNVSIYEVDI